MDLRDLIRPIAIPAGLAVVVTSIVVAISLHRPPYTGSCLRAPCPHSVGYPLALRVAVVAAAVLIAGAGVCAARTATRRSPDRS